MFNFIFFHLLEIYDSNDGLVFSYSRMPHLFTKDIALVQQLFEALCKEEPETRLAIQEALSMMVGAYSTLEGAQRTLMEALVASYLIKVGPTV